MKLKIYIKKIIENSNLNKGFYLSLLLYVIFILFYIFKNELLPFKKFSENILIASFISFFCGIIYFKNLYSFIFSCNIFTLFIIFQLIKIYL